MVDPASVVVVADTNSAARPADRGTPRPDDKGYWAFVRAFNLRDLVDLHPVPTETYSCFQGTARSRIDTVACHSDATVAVASYHCWGSTLMSDHHVPLLFTLTHLVVRLGKPCPHTVSRTPKYHVGPVVFFPADAADFWASVLRRRDIDPQFAPVCWPEVPAARHLRLGKGYGPGPNIQFLTLPPPVAPGREGLPLAVPKCAVLGAQHAPLGGSLHRGGPKHARGLRDGWAHP